MTSEEFAAGKWIDRLARGLVNLSKAQEPYLQQYYKENPRVHVLYGGQGSDEPAFPLDDLRDLYAMALHSNIFGEEEYYAALCTVLNPVRHILRSHPTLTRVVSPIIGRDEFWMQVLNTGSLTSPADLIAGLMAHAGRLSEDRFRMAAGELNALLNPDSEGGPAGVPGKLDIGYDMVLFYGLTLKEYVDVVDGMVLLPFEQIRAFVDERQVKELAPPGAGFNGWRSVGAVVRPFRWRPAFRRIGFERELDVENSGPFFQEVRIFLDLLAVAHATPVLHLANLAHCIDRSAGRLLGRANHHGNFDRGPSAQNFDGFDECLELAPVAVAEAREAFEERKSERFAKVAPIVSRLAEALARDGRFADEVRIVDVAIALERMYDLPRRKISRKLRNRVSSYIGTDMESRERLKESVKEFYDVRSDIVHSRSSKVSPRRKRKAFRKGFDIARKTLFKLLHEGQPENWGQLMIAGD